MWKIVVHETEVRLRGGIAVEGRPDVLFASLMYRL